MTHRRARLPYALGRMTIEQEFLSLMELKRRTDRRLDFLVRILDPDHEHRPAAGLKLVSGDLQQGSVG